MLTSLAYIFLVGLSMGAICKKIKLPPIIGMLLTGVLLGPYVLNFLDASILNISADLRKLALIIILLKAGLSLNLRDLKKVGRPALLMSFIPASLEIIGYILVAPLILKVSLIEAALMGSIMAAVSPAVVVPKMVMLIEKGYGTNKSIPQMILAGASLDDVYVIVLFTTFIGMAQGGGASLLSFAEIPISIGIGIAFGVIAGLAVSSFFQYRYKHKSYIRNSTKLIIILALSFLMVAIEERLKGFVPMSSLLAVMSMAIVIKIKNMPNVSRRLSEKFSKLWIAAELVLFVLVGAAVDIRYAASAGFGVVAVVFLTLLFRILGVGLCLIKTPLNQKERLFCVISYLPKATVQAAIGAVPLSLGLPGGKLILSVAVIAIMITAPLGAFGIDQMYERLLQKAD